MFDYLRKVVSVFTQEPVRPEMSLADKLLSRDLIETTNDCGEKRYIEVSKSEKGDFSVYSKTTFLATFPAPQTADLCEFLLFFKFLNLTKNYRFGTCFGLSIFGAKQHYNLSFCGRRLCVMAGRP